MCSGVTTMTKQKTDTQRGRRAAVSEITGPDRLHVRIRAGTKTYLLRASARFGVPPCRLIDMLAAHPDTLEAILTRGVQRD